MSLKKIPRQNIILRLEFILRRRGLPDKAALVKTLEAGLKILKNEDPAIRPTDKKNRPGGLIRLKSEEYYVIIPDLHGRMGFFNAVMRWSGFSGRPLFADMANRRAQVICVGDAFHSEARGRVRWQKAMKEWSTGYKTHKHMDSEMRENLGLLEMLNVVKTAYPNQFHFLKGNHENIANEQGGGNFPFRKFAVEGEMVKLWVQTFLGMELFDIIYRWEKALPLMAEGQDFIVSHAEPGRGVSPDEVINAYETPDLIRDLTWVDNGQAADYSVAGTLHNFAKDEKLSRIFGGHRAVRGCYALRQDGRYVQINTPNSWVIAAFSDMKNFQPDNNIICLKQG